MPFVEAAIALGAHPKWVFFVYVLPGSLLALLTAAPMVITANLTALAAPDFLGLGLPPPAPSWGELMGQGQAYYTWAPWLAFVPAAWLFVTLLSLTFLGEGLRRSIAKSS